MITILKVFDKKYNDNDNNILYYIFREIHIFVRFVYKKFKCYLSQTVML